MVESQKNASKGYNDDDKFLCYRGVNKTTDIFDFKDIKSVIPQHGVKMTQVLGKNERRTGMEKFDGGEYYDRLQDFKLYAGFSDDKSGTLYQGSAFMLFGNSYHLKRHKISTKKVVILTAAHCVSTYDLEKKELKLFDKIQLYYQYSNNNDNEVYPYHEIYVHPRYEGKPDTGYDIAIISLDEMQSKRWQMKHGKKKCRGFNPAEMKYWMRGQPLKVLQKDGKTMKATKVNMTVTVFGYPGEYNQHDEKGNIRKL